MNESTEQDTRRVEDRLWSRRSLLGAAACAGASLAVAPVLRASGRDQVRERFAGLPLGLHGMSLRGFSTAEAVRMTVEDLGLHWLELTLAQIRLREVTRGRFAGPAATPAEIRELRELLSNADVTPTAYGPIQISGTESSNRDLFARAADLGVRNLTCIPEPSSIDSLEALADEYGIRLAIHNNAPGSPFDRIADVVKAIDRRGPNVGACLDMGNAIRGSEDPAGALRRLGDRVFGIHLKDVSGRDPDSDVIVLGKGFLDVPEFFAALAEVGFPDDGALSLEHLEQPEDPLPGIRESLEIAAAAVA